MNESVLINNSEEHKYTYYFNKGKSYLKGSLLDLCVPNMSYLNNSTTPGLFIAQEDSTVQENNVLAELTECDLHLPTMESIEFTETIIRRKKGRTTKVIEAIVSSLPVLVRKEILKNYKKNEVPDAVGEFEVQKAIERINRRAIRKAVKTNLVKNFHETKEIKFNVISIHILYGLQKQMIYKSPTYNRQQSSSYYIGVIDGELAYIRKSNHWGKFTTNIYEWDNAVGFEGISGDFYGRVGYNYYNWELKGGERTKQGVYKHTSQAGYVFIRDIQNGKFNCATLAGRS